MNQHFFWQQINGRGIEHLALLQTNDSIFADGWVISEGEGGPFRLHYTVTCDHSWCTRHLTAAILLPGFRHTEMTISPDGVWTDNRNNSLEILDGCVDLDISATPFTNTLPIRRLNLQAGEAAIIEVAYLSVPDLEWQMAMQRYTCLEKHSRGGRYRFESLRSDFTAEISVDADGLVTHYPGLFKRG